MKIEPINIIPENLCFMDFDDEEVQALVIKALAEAIQKNQEAGSDE